MTVFIDTNVILDYVLRREHYAEAKETIVKLVEATSEIRVVSPIELCYSGDEQEYGRMSVIR